MAERFRSLARPSGCLLGALLFFLTAQPAAAVNYGTIEVVTAGEPRGHSSHGYTEYRLLVRHKGKENSHRVTLTLPGNDQVFGQGHLDSVSRSVIIEPGKTISVPLWVPTQPALPGQGVAVRIDGRLEKERVPLAIFSGFFRGMGPGGGQRLVLLSRSVPEDLLTPPARPVRGFPGGMAAPEGPGFAPGGGAPPGGGAAEEVPGPAGRGKRGRPAAGGGAAPPVVPPGPMLPGGGAAGGPMAGMAGPGGMMFRSPFTLNGEAIRADLPISAWSPHWLGYTRWDAIIVTSEDLNDLARGGNETVAVLQTLYQYVESGGTMLVLGPGEVVVPTSWRRFREKRDGFTVYSPAFGQCLVSSDRRSAAWSDDSWSLFSRSLDVTLQPWNNNTFGTGNLNESLPVMDSSSVSATWLFAVMVLFTVLIGPVNLMWLSKHNRRIWMLWTVPVVSFFTCVLVFGFMVVTEGWQGHTVMASVTLLDEVEKRATTMGRAAYYSPLTPGDGLRFSPETEVSPLGREHSVFKGSCSMDWNDGQHLSRGWVIARAPSHLTLRKSEPRRERIQVTREGNSLAVQNLLGVDIRTIVLADEKGRLHEGSDIAAGAKATLKPTGQFAKATPNAWRVLYSSGNLAASLSSVAAHPEDHLRPRTYLAEVEESPFLEQGLRGATLRTRPRVVQKEDKVPPPTLVLGVMADLGLNP
jgi:hypothetical protein